MLVGGSDASEVTGCGHSFLVEDFGNIYDEDLMVRARYFCVQMFRLLFSGGCFH